MKILYIILTFLAINLYSLDPNIQVSQYITEKWDTNRGLPQNSVKGLIQTKDGYLWFGTQEGVVKFDGEKMKIYDLEFFKELKSIEIYSIVDDIEPNKIWIGTMGGGLIHFDYVKENYKIYKKKDGLLRDFIYYMSIDSDGRLWIDQNSDKIVVFENGDFKTIPYPKDQKISVLSMFEYKDRVYFSTKNNFLLYTTGKIFHKTSNFEDKITHIYQLKSDKNYIAIGERNVYKYDPKNNTYTKFFDGIKNWRVTRVLEDSDQNIWILTGNKGVYRFRKGAKSIDKNVDYLKLGLPILAIEDREKNIWIGDNYGGVIQLKKGKIINFTDIHGLPKAPVYPLLVGKKGEFYVGTLGDGVLKYKDHKFKQIFPELKKETILSIDQNSKGELWIGAYKKKIFKIENGKVIEKHKIDPYKNLVISMLYIDSKDRLWIGTGREGVYIFENDKLIKHIKIKGYISAIKEIGDSFWIGSSGDGITILKNMEIYKKYGEKNGCSESVYSIYKEKIDKIWISAENGICFYDGKKFYKMGKKEGVPVNSVNDIVVDKFGDIWAGSNKGIVYAKWIDIENFIKGDIKKVDFKIFRKKEGMINPECNGGSQYNMVKSEGKIYVPTMGGISIIDPENMEINKNIPPVYITNLNYDEKIVDSFNIKSITLPAGTEKLEFNYTALSFNSPQYIKFKYKLEGYDKNWVKAKGRRVAYYTSLPPGDYNFKVIASNGDGVWNMEGDSLKFKILPLFSQTIWFTILQIAAVVIFVILIFGFKLWQSKKARIKLQKLVDEKTKELKEASLRDPLTGLRNRRSLSEIVLPELNSFISFKKYSLKNSDKRKGDRDRDVFAIYLCDIDHFKKVNDTYGHEAGDRVLKQFSKILESCVRENDFVIRWGGEEFLVILKNTDSEKMDVFINRFRERMNSYNFVINDNGDTIQKTCSVGYLKYPPIDQKPNLYTFDQAVMVADLGLYYSKENGRNMGVKIEFTKIPDDNIRSSILENLDLGVEKNIYKITTIKD